MSRFFVFKEFQVNDNVIISGDDAYHIIKVLRCKPGDLLKLSDGKLTEGEAEIVDIDYKNIQIKTRIIANNKMKELYPKITLFQGLPKGDKMSLIIQKTTEIGVSSIVPLKTKRTIVEIEPDKIDVKRQRWQRVAMEAAKQCMRIDIPKVEIPQDFNTCLSQLDNFQLVIIPWEMEHSKNIKEVLKESTGDIRDIAVFIGPEGGFSEEEIEIAKNTKAVCVSLGPRILRTETAAMAVCSILMYEFGDLGGYRCQK